MKQHLWLTLTIPLTLGSALAGDTKGWEPFTSKEHGFSILMPGKPLENTQNVKSPVGQLEVTTFFADHGKDAAVMISVTQYPESALKFGPAKLLDSARDGAVSSSKGKLKAETKITLGAHQGRDLTIESDTRGHMRTRIFLVGSRLIQTMAIGPKGYPQSKEATTFLDSLKLIK